MRKLFSTIVATVAALLCGGAFGDYFWTGSDITSDGWVTTANWTITGGSNTPADGKGPNSPESAAWAPIWINGASGTVADLEGWTFNLNLGVTTNESGTVISGTASEFTVENIRKLQGGSTINIGTDSTLTLTKGASNVGNDGGLFVVNFVGAGTVNLNLANNKGGDETVLNYGDVTPAEGKTIGAFNVASSSSGTAHTYNTAIEVVASFDATLRTETIVLNTVKLGTISSDITLSTLIGTITAPEGFSAGSGVLTAVKSCIGKYSVAKDADGNLNLYYVTGPESAVDELGKVPYTWLEFNGDLTSTKGDAEFGFGGNNSPDGWVAGAKGAASTALQGAHMWGNTQLNLGDGDWSIVMVAKLSATANGVAFSAGSVSWGAYKTLSILSNGSENPGVSLVSAGASSTVNLSVSVPNATTAFNVYKVSYVKSSKTYTISVNGELAAQGTYEFVAQQSHYQFGGTHGGTRHVACDDTVIDDFRIYHEAITDAQAQTILPSFLDTPDYVAQIGDVKFSTVANAFASIHTGSISLLKDSYETMTVPVTGNKTLVQTSGKNPAKTMTFDIAANSSLKLTFGKGDGANNNMTIKVQGAGETSVVTLDATTGVGLTSDCVFDNVKLVINSANSSTLWFTTKPTTANIKELAVATNVTVQLETANTLTVGKISGSGTIGQDTYGGQPKLKIASTCAFEGSVSVPLILAADVSLTLNSTHDNITTVEDYIVEKTGEGPYTYTSVVAKTPMERLTEAVAAAETGATVALTENVEGAIEFNSEKTITIDLAGYTWTVADENVWAALKVLQGKVIITDSSEGKTGKMVNAATFCVWCKGGEVDINGGRFENDSNDNYAVYANATGVVTINGGTFVNKNTDPYKYNASLKSLNLNVAQTQAGSTGQGTIIVKGGSYTAYPRDDSGIEFVASGYEATESEGIWTVREKSVTPVDPGSAATEVVADDAEAAAAKVEVAVPEAVAEELTTEAAQAAYKAMFEVKATAVEGETGKFNVTVELKESVAAAVKEDVDAAEAMVLEAALDTETTEATITTKPGLYYAIEYGDEPGLGKNTAGVMATSETTNLAKPAVSGTAAFFRVKASVTPIDETK